MQFYMALILNSAVLFILEEESTWASLLEIGRNKGIDGIVVTFPLSSLLVKHLCKFFDESKQ